MNEFNLKYRMDNWGPFGEKEAQWLIFSIGNPFEGHGYALPKAIDDFHAKKAAQDLEKATGQRYVAHIPYTTDRCGDVAKEWAPSYLPWDEFIEKVIDYMDFCVKSYKRLDLKAEKIFLITGHGGNAGLLKKRIQEQIQEKLDVKLFSAVSATVTTKGGLAVLNQLESLAEQIIDSENERFGVTDPEELAFIYSKILLSAGHASHAEHSLAAAMGLCDMKKVTVMNSLLEKDFEGALKKWPPIGGLGGYLIAGGKYTEALGTKENDKYGLWNCLEGLRNLQAGKLLVAPELGGLIHQIGLEEKKNFIEKN